MVNCNRSWRPYVVWGACILCVSVLLYTTMSTKYAIKDALIIKESLKRETLLQKGINPNVNSCPTKCFRSKFNGRYYSQSGEDRAVFTKYFSNPPVCNGTYLEIGALDGVTYSNTKFFEDTMDWNGILIEAQPQNYKNLKKNRPKSKTYGVAICPEGQKTIKFAGGGAVGGVVEEMTDHHKKHWIGKSKEIEIPCRTMSGILKEAGTKKIDFFTLDVEGSELKVLETMDWSIPVRVFVVEFAGEDKIKDEAVRTMLQSHGYVKVSWNIRSFCSPGGDCASNEVWENKDQKQFTCETTKS